MEANGYGCACVRQLAREHGQGSGQPQPRVQQQGKPGPAGQPEKLFYGVFQGNPLTAAPPQQIQGAEDAGHVRDIPCGHKADHQTAQQRPGPLAIQQILCTHEQHRQPQHPVQPHERHGVGHVVGHQSIAKGNGHRRQVAAPGAPAQQQGEGQTRQTQLQRHEEHHSDGHMLVGAKQCQQGEGAGHIVGEGADIAASQRGVPRKEYLPVLERAQEFYKLVGQVKDENGTLPKGGKAHGGAHRQKDQRGKKEGGKGEGTLAAGHGGTPFQGIFLILSHNR